MEQFSDSKEYSKFVKTSGTKLNLDEKIVLD